MVKINFIQFVDQYKDKTVLEIKKMNDYEL